MQQLLKKRLLLALGIIVLVLLIDQSVKFWVKTHMLIGEESYLHWGWPISWFKIKFTENSGMAFGIRFPGKFGKIFLTLLRLVLIVVLIYFLVKNAHKYHWLFTVFMALIIAGAIGNLIDSMFYGLIFTESPVYSYGAEPARLVKWGEGYGKFLMGKVVDMIQFPLCSCTIPQWFPVIGGREFVFFNPIFNIADSSIFIGVVGFLLFNKKISRHEQITENS